MESDAAEARAQLAALQTDRAALAGRLVQPWWWDVAFGVLVAAFFSSYSSHSIWVIGAALLVFSLGVRWLMAVYQRITGTWWDASKVGPVQDRVRRALRRLVVGYVVLLALGGALEFLLDVRGAMVGVGVVMGTAAGLSSRWVTRIYVAGLRAGS
ncbi:hypothetical protein DQ244_01375 [Blastococcus sp. TBT05-19]|uniref:hypothetical protein n=1 Tax=Blastococcus sp. TBT05-19 TaxID=2250581 RepID=UPI000DEC0255|nr:hypothetical protein [Blastococcus sp. TBT05-19]RBY94047.1 hypothetical protein DQ244_01375 [Blastococcus sp. TBT05-19]